MGRTDSNLAYTNECVFLVRKLCSKTAGGAVQASDAAPRQADRQAGRATGQQAEPAGGAADRQAAQRPGNLLPSKKHTLF